MTDQDGEQEPEQSQDQGNNIGWVHGDPEDRPAMDARSAESTDWMAAAELENKDSDLTDREKRRLRAEQAKRERKAEASRPTVIQSGEETDSGESEDESRS